MLDRPMTIERLLAHSIIFDEAARLHRNEHVASELRAARRELRSQAHLAPEVRRVRRAHVAFAS